MPDKNIDQLFRSKLNDLEVQPSANVWQGIADALPQSRRNYTAWLSVAASIVILITAGILFLPEKPVKNNPGATKVIKSNTTGKLANRIEQPIINRNTENDVIKTDVRVAVNPNKKQHTSSIKSNGPTQIINVSVKTVTLTTDTQPEQTIASVEPKPLQQAMVPDAQLADKTDNNTISGTLPSVALAANNDEQEQPKKHKIHGLGSLINMVVASVDKRQDKIIEFSDSDEGDSVTGINLGIIKIKRDK